MSTEPQDVKAVLEEYEQQLLKDGIPKSSIHGFDIHDAYEEHVVGKPEAVRLRYPIDVSGKISEMVAERIAKKFGVGIDNYCTWCAEDTAEAYHQTVFSITLDSAKDVKPWTKKIRDAAMVYRDALRKHVDEIFT